MSLKIKGLAWTTVVVALLGAAIPAAASAQGRRHAWREQYRQYWNPPGSSVRIFPIPREGYHYGGVHIYRLPGARWPYGYPEGYRWPYGNTTYSYPARSYWHHRHSWRR